MSPDLVNLAGYLLALFIGGYAGGFILQAMRRFFEQI